MRRGALQELNHQTEHCIQEARRHVEALERLRTLVHEAIEEVVYLEGVLDRQIEDATKKNNAHK